MDDMKAREQDHSQLAQRIRPYLICLRQLESVYVLAGWILKLFLSILSRSSRPEDGTAPAGKENTEMPAIDANSSAFDESGFSFFLRTLPSSPLNANHIAELSMPASFDFTPESNRE